MKSIGTFRGTHTNKQQYSHIYFGMTITRAEVFCLPQHSIELIASAENTSDGSIWPCTWVCEVSAAESELGPSLTRERKKLNSQNKGRHYFPTGDIFFRIVLSSVHTINSTKSGMIALLAGKHKSDDDDLEI